VEAPHEGHVDMLEPMRSDEVEAPVSSLSILLSGSTVDFMFNFLNFRFSSTPLLETPHECHVDVLMRSDATIGTVSCLFTFLVVLVRSVCDCL